MSSDLSELTAQILALPLEERVELAQKLWNSLDSVPPDPSRRAEIAALVESRDNEWDRGEAQPTTHQDAMLEARQALQ